MSPISENLKQDAWSQESNLPLVLLEIDHDDLAEPILIVNNKENVTSNGDEYIAFPFEIFLPDSRDDAPPTAKLRIDNVSREIVEAIRSISSPPSVTIKVIRQETPDVIEMEFAGMVLRHIPFDALTVEGNLEFEDLTREPFPAHTFNPANYPGVL
jgi:hypothetical protein